MIYTINEAPITNKRHRTSRGRTYDPNREVKDRWRWILKAQHKGALYADVPLCLDIVFYMPIPTSFSEKKRLALDGTAHIKKPDRDNLEKLLYDCCTGVIVKDD